MLRTRKPLSVELGPGLLGMTYDGLQRPLESIAVITQDLYIPRGVAIPALDKKRMWPFRPAALKVRKNV